MTVTNQTKQTFSQKIPSLPPPLVPASVINFLVKFHSIQFFLFHLFIHSIFSALQACTAATKTFNAQCMLANHPIPILLLHPPIHQSLHQLQQIIAKNPAQILTINLLCSELPKKPSKQIFNQNIIQKLIMEKWLWLIPVLARKTGLTNFANLDY